MVPGIKIAVLGRCQKVGANKPVCASSRNKPQALGCRTSRTTTDPRVGQIMTGRCHACSHPAIFNSVACCSSSASGQKTGAME
jgi:hypothetical protein